MRAVPSGLKARPIHRALYFASLVVVPVVLRKRPRHSPLVRPGRQRPNNNRAMPCLDQAKSPCRGPGRRAVGLLANSNVPTLLPHRHQGPTYARTSHVS
uniref:Uncharacterized protein n=1 Tax=Oryza rufipogon TaxID=4529 RepID=A0A0E0QFX0_ORYRU